MFLTALPIAAAIGFVLLLQQFKDVPPSIRNYATAGVVIVACWKAFRYSLNRLFVRDGYPMLGTLLLTAVATTSLWLPKAVFICYCVRVGARELTTTGERVELKAPMFPCGFKMIVRSSGNTNVENLTGTLKRQSLNAGFFTEEAVPSAGTQLDKALWIERFEHDQTIMVSYALTGGTDVRYEFAGLVPDSLCIMQPEEFWSIHRNYAFLGIALWLCGNAVGWSRYLRQ